MTVTWSPAALDDLTDIYAYIADENPESAERVVRAIVHAVEGLTTFPSMGRIGALPGTRERLMRRYRYKIVYRVRGDGIEIVRVISTSRNWP